jgi:hypothetical protein
MTRETNIQAQLERVNVGDTLTVEITYSNNRGTLRHTNVTVWHAGWTIATSSPFRLTRDGKAIDGVTNGTVDVVGTVQNITVNNTPQATP